MQRRRVLGPLLAGWLLGVVTALIVPGVLYERQTITGSNPPVLERILRGETSSGWVVTKVESASAISIIQLERPRYLAIAEGLSDVTAWLQDLISGRPPAPTPTPAPTKPTEAPKPAR